MDSNDVQRLLRRGVAEIIVEEELVKLLETGKPLRLKQGFDPSRPDIHLGHVVGLRKLRQFQELGHQLILIVGDWTAQIGDPSGQSATRQMLSAEEVRANAETYMQQFFSVVDREKTQVVWQSEWFGKFGLADVIQLTRRFTVAQMLERDDFARRYKQGNPIAVTELLYPLLQAYDSIMIEADVEFGGTDQKFNCLVGRELQRMEGQRPQQVFLMPLLVGTDGSQKMSKSLGNYIGVEDPPPEMYGKVMSISDAVMMDYFELLTDVPDEELDEYRQKMDEGSLNPMEPKMRLAREIVTQFHSPEAATEAEGSFNGVVRRGELPPEIPTVRFSGGPNRQVSIWSTDRSIDVQVPGPPCDLDVLLFNLGLANSRNEARRLLSQHAVEVDGEKQGWSRATRPPSLRMDQPSYVIKVGKVHKGRLVRLVNADAASSI
jgi:tyrosyl-tRNA synthetase